jgi:hypothetical protein
MPPPSQTTRAPCPAATLAPGRRREPRAPRSRSPTDAACLGTDWASAKRPALPGSFRSGSATEDGVGYCIVGKQESDHDQRRLLRFVLSGTLVERDGDFRFNQIVCKNAASTRLPETVVRVAERWSRAGEHDQCRDSSNSTL